MLLLFGLLWCSVALSAQWDQYFAQWEGKPGSMIVNMDYIDLLPQEDLPFLVSIGLAYDNCSNEGFPDTITYGQLTELSDKLEEYMNIQLTGSLVGTFTYDCRRMDYYYVKDTIGVRAFAESFFENNGIDFHPLISMAEDREWRYYQDVIYPDDYLLEYMMNAKVIDALIDQGINIQTPSLIQHWAYFKSEGARDRYRLIVLERGFKEENKDVDPLEEYPYTLQFSRRDKVEPDYITELTYNLQKEAKAIDGYYDGWEYEVPKLDKP